jgi:hypothetical protein
MLSLLFIITSCGVSEDCFKGKGNRVSQTFPIENFTKIKVYDGVGLVIKEGANYEVRIETSDNIIDVLDVRLNGDMLIVKDNSTCNVARDYGQTVVYVTSPNLEEIHSKTDQDIKSDGILNYPLLRLFSMDLSDGAGTGDFYINLESTGQFVIESNNVSNFYLNGYTNQLLLSFYFGNGRFYGENLEAEEIILFQRGSNDMIVKPLQSISGTIYATGNVILKNVPPIIEVEEVFTGRLIY